MLARTYSNQTESNVDKPDQDMPIEGMANPYERERRRCILCQYKVTLDYKNPRLLSQFVSPFTGKLYERNVTGLCRQQQKLLESEVKRSRKAGYMPYMLKKVEWCNDPKLCDPSNPVRPHRF